jgi:hypothetical protein
MSGGDFLFGGTSIGNVWDVGTGVVKGGNVNEKVSLVQCASDIG